MIHTLATNQPGDVTGLAAVRNKIKPHVAPHEWAAINVTLRYGGVCVAITGGTDLLLKVIRLLMAEGMLDAQ